MRRFTTPNLDFYVLFSRALLEHDHRPPALNDVNNVVCKILEALVANIDIGQQRSHQAESSYVKQVGKNSLVLAAGS
jgi:hypothetical protein